MKDTNKAYLKWSVTPKGFKFEIYKEGENIPVKKWETIFQKLSKHELVAIQILNQLVDEDQAEIAEENIILPYITVAHLPDEERDTLGLPEPFPFDIEIRASGNLTDPNFRYIYRFLNGKSQPFVNPKRIGTYLEITPEQTYLLVGEVYHLIESLDEFNQKSLIQRDIKTNLLTFTKIKGLAQETAAILDTYLNSEEIIAPSKITLRLKRIDKDVIEIEPVFCEETSDPDGNPALKPILRGHAHKHFLKIFDRFSKERDIYAIPRGPRIVLTEQQKETLGQVKRHRRVSGKKKEILLKNPSEFFNPEVIEFNTPLIKDGKLLSWSDRVIAIGEYKPHFFSFIRPAKEPWLPPEGGVIIDGTMVYLTPDEAKQFKQRLEYAIQQGKEEVVWKGQKLPASKEAIQAITELTEIRPSSETTSKESVEKLQKIDGKRNILTIKDNFEEIDYASGSEIHRPGEISLPKMLRSGINLLPHQEEGLKWLQILWINGAKGALLADDMGLGKTLQALSFMAWVQELIDNGQFHLKPMLVIAPVTLLENWKEEYRRFLEPIWGPFIELHGAGLKQFKKYDLARALDIKKEIEIKDKEDAEVIISSGRGLLLEIDKIPKKAVVITTYETLRDYQFSFGLIDWAIIVVDEAQKIKTPAALVTTAIKAMKYEFGIALTGTPVENSWVDLWSIMDFVQPAHLGSLKEFVAQYHNPLRKPETDREALGRNLKEKVSPLLKRRMKEDHLKGLPEKYVCPYKVEMPQIQLEHYLDIVQKARESLPDPLSGQRKQHIFSVIGALRDISLHPYLPIFNEQGLVDFSDEEIINASARLMKTTEILDKICQKGEKAIVFLISRKMQRVLQRLIKNRYGIYAHFINGEVTGGRRKSLIDAFQSTNGFNVIIMSPEAAGVGLNVTAANHVIHLSRPWNPAKEDQATDRVYRIGQKRPVFVHVPLAVHPMFDNEICKGTFDLKLHRLLEHKRQLSRSVLLPTVIEEKEWQTMGEEILSVTVEKRPTSTLTITDIDHMSAEMFEKAIASLYRKMGYQVELTPFSRDQGADVVALKHRQDGNSLLIQCKHTSNPNKAQNQKGIQEVLAACGVYQQEYNAKFKTIVITNAKRFTDQAMQIAEANGVNLIPREKLAKLLKDYGVMLEEIL